MTIKEFAGLCGCNPQTLRYYDHVDLLKPVRVDPWSGYRFYEEEAYSDLLNNPSYEAVYEKHGWDNVKDFLEECKDLEDGAEYALHLS